MQVIEDLRRLGFEIEAVGDRVRVRHPFQPRPEALPLLEQIRQHKAEVLAALTGPQPREDAHTTEVESDADILHGFVGEALPLPPTLPNDLRLVSYAPKKPPVALEECSIVTNVELFIQSSLADLEYRMNHADEKRLGRTISQILDRLHQVGVVIEVESKVADISSS